MSFFTYSDKTLAIAAQAEKDVQHLFAHIDDVAAYNSEKVLAAFQNNRVSEVCFAGSTGYGNDDYGREKLGQVFAEIFKTEDAMARTTFVSGTHAISCALFGSLRPGDKLVYAIGRPYDTMESVIGVTGNYPGNMLEYGIMYEYVPTIDGLPDLQGIARASSDAKVVMIQRSKGYSSRKSLSIDEIEEIVKVIKAANANAIVMVDNCYGEFVEKREPTEVGADLVVGSLIKNPGGGIAPMGGYIAGRHDLVEAAAMRMTTPGIGRECGASLNSNRQLYQGLFLAPHTVAQALKTAVFCARTMDLLGYKTIPAYDDARADIVQLVEFGNADALEKFCCGIQHGAPVDSYVTPQFAPMPGYDDPVIMAAGAFIQGSSIELSADGPKREPFCAYMQGGLTYETGRAGVMHAIDRLVDKG